MTAILNSLVTVLGAWLVVSPYLLGTRGVALAIAIAAGAIALVLSIVAIKQEAYKPTLDYVLCALGIALALWGIVGWIAGLGAGLSEIIVGALVAALSFGTTRFAHTYAGASFYDRGGAPMVDVQSLRMKDGTILMKALLLQSMPSTVYIKPEEVWKVLTMVPFDLIKQMPVFLYQGYKACKSKGDAAKGMEGN